jgi:hypothetical protein
MKSARLALLASAFLAPTFGQYVYDYASLLNPIHNTYWTIHGNESLVNNFYTSVDNVGTSMIFQPALPAPASSYEVRTTLTLAQSGGTYLTYLRATSNAQFASGNTGTFYVAEIANPTFSNGSCTATLHFYKQVNGTVEGPLNSEGIYNCHSGMVVRTVMLAGAAVEVFVDNKFINSYYDQEANPISSGQPGVGVIGAPSGNGISAIDIGHLCTTPPPPIDANEIGTSVFPNRVDIQFPGVIDIPTGPGIAYYQYYKDITTWLTFSYSPNIEDRSVVPSTNYSYTLQAVDFHGNISQVIVNITTPPAGAIDPREVGCGPRGLIGVQAANKSTCGPAISISPFR